MNCIPIVVASMGPADHGKSTLFGYICLNYMDTVKSSLYWQEIDRMRRQEGDRYRRDRVYSYLFDRRKDERYGQSQHDGKIRFRGTSMVSTHLSCEIGEKYFFLIDTPGHEKFLRNATKGIFQAKFAVLVVAAPDLEAMIRSFEAREATVKGRQRIHANISAYPVLINTCDFGKLIIAVTKMDLVGYDPKYYSLAVALRVHLAYHAGRNEHDFEIIPTSIDVDGRTDVNVIKRVNSTHEMSWYQGPTLVEVLNQFNPVESPIGRLFIPVETVYWKKIGQAPLIFTGHIMRGVLREGMEVQVVPLYGSTGDQSHYLFGKVKKIQLRDESDQLPWRGSASVGKLDYDEGYHAGLIVGMQISPLGEFRKWDWREYEHYFRKGCIITEIHDKVLVGNVMKVELPVSELARPLKVGENWVVFLYGKVRGDAMILSKYPIAVPTGHGLQVELLLFFPIAYPGKDIAGQIELDDIPRNVLLQQENSLYGGRVIDLYSPDIIETVVGNPELESIKTGLGKMYGRGHLRCQYELIKGNPTILKAFKPTSKDIQVIYKTLRAAYRNSEELPGSKVIPI